MRSAWFHALVRVALAVLALWVVLLAKDRAVAFEQDYAANFRMDIWLWLAWIGTATAAGLLFGLAVILPFERIRYRWSRLLLAAIPILPLAHFWYVFGYAPSHDREVSGWLSTSWFWDFGTLFVLAALVGVTVASGVAVAQRPVRSQPSPPPRPPDPGPS